MAQEQIPLHELPAWLQAVAARLGSQSFSEPLKRCAVSVRAATKQNFSKSRGPNGQTWPPIKFPRPRGGGGQKPLRDTGLLMTSVTTKGAQGSIEQVGDTSLRIGTNVDRATIHQYGGILRPKSGKALAIPLTRQAVNAGRPGRMANLKLVWPKGKSHGWLVEEKGGRGKSGRGANTIMHWLLVPKATIPARPFLGWNPEMADECSKIVGDWTEQELAKV